MWIWLRMVSHGNWSVCVNTQLAVSSPCLMWDIVCVWGGLNTDPGSAQFVQLLRPFTTSCNHLPPCCVPWSLKRPISWTSIHDPSQMFASCPAPALLSMAFAHTRHIQCDFKGSQTAFRQEREVACGKSITHPLSVERECKKGDRMEIIFRGDEEQFRSPWFTNTALSVPYVYC